MRSLTVVVLAVALLFVAVPASAAKSFGLIPTLTKADEPKIATRAESPPEVPGEKPIMVLGLEAMSWFGPDASVAFAVTGKREIGGGWKAINGTFYAGYLIGFTEPDVSGPTVAHGGILQLAVGDIPAISVLLRPQDGGLLINPGFDVTLIGRAF